MLSLPLPVKIYLCVAPADMRRGFDGLANLVREWLGQDPLSGHLFVFRNLSKRFFPLGCLQGTLILAAVEAKQSEETRVLSDLA